MFTVGHTTNDMAKSTERLLGFSGLFHSGAGVGDTAGMHLAVYKMNFPRKNPMKMAAMTTRREGKEAELASRPRRLVEFDVMWSERGTFLILTPSSCKRGRRGMTSISFDSRAENSQQIDAGHFFTFFTQTTESKTSPESKPLSKEYSAVFTLGATLSGRAPNQIFILSYSWHLL